METQKTSNPVKLAEADLKKLEDIRHLTSNYEPGEVYSLLVDIYVDYTRLEFEKVGELGPQLNMDSRLRLLADLMGFFR